MHNPYILKSKYGQRDEILQFLETKFAKEIYFTTFVDSEIKY